MNRHDSPMSSTGTASDPASILVSSKIRDWHLQRQVIVYIRQSTMQQVLDHRESTARQYALEQRAITMGWAKDRVTLIDDDQGQSGQSVEGRLGFQRLLAEVGLDHVGIIFGLEMSRLARSNKDWHQLLELCAIFRTLLADQDGVYDPTDYNDRLLLGLKGTMSEAELHILRSRMYQGLLNKAQRGEIFNHAPIGYIKTAKGEFAIDPDEQVQGVVRLIFDQFDRLGTLQGVLRYLVANGIRMPVRPHHGATRGELEWHRPNRVTLQNLLRRPLYAGYYRWGHRQVDPRRKIAGRRSTGRTSRPPKECKVLLEGRCPAYIATERFWANQAKLDANCEAHQRLTNHGPSLLGGLLVCGRCGRSFLVQYTNGGTGLRYVCQRGVIDYGEPACQSLSGGRLDALVGAEVLAALEPATLELHLSAAADVERERERLHEHWRQRLERARYETERARRQYQAVEPENRLVARTLESAWEKALHDLRQLEDEYERFRATQPRILTTAELEQIRALAEDIPQLWHAATTTTADRRQIVHLLIDQIALDVHGETEQVSVLIHWSGGNVSQRELTRAVQCYEQMSGYKALWKRICELSDSGMPHREIATKLNAEGYHPPKRADQFTGAMVSHLLAKQGRSGPRPKSLSSRGMLKQNEWLLSDLARALSMPSATLHRWRKVGWVRSRKLSNAGGYWGLWAPPKELKRLTKLRDYQQTQPHRPIAPELTTPLQSKKKS
jgi:DNA invertase Pin-like site-specific DNA recombinase